MSGAGSLVARRACTSAGISSPRPDAAIVPPLQPLTTHHSPLTTRHPSQNPRPRSRPQVAVHRVQEHRQEKIENEDCDKGAYERLGGGTADAFGAGAAVYAPVAADDRYGGAEKRRLDQPRRDVPGADEALGVMPVMVGL